MRRDTKLQGPTFDHDKHVNRALNDRHQPNRLMCIDVSLKGYADQVGCSAHSTTQEKWNEMERSQSRSPVAGLHESVNSDQIAYHSCCDIQEQ